jgi:tetratricopeptide (TPR) repeat protein
MANLACLYQDQHLYEKAEELFSKLVTIRRQHDHLDPFAGWLARFGMCLLEQKKYSKAESILREALMIREERMPQDWRRFNVMSLLGASLVGQAQSVRTANFETAEQKLAEAESLLVQSYEGMKQQEARIPAFVKEERLRKGLQRVVDLYDVWEKPEKASEWRKKSE